MRRDLSGVAEHPQIAQRRKPVPPPQKNRGSGAWKRRITEDDLDDLNLLHLHAVTDRVALNSYIPSAQRCFRWAAKKNQATSGLNDLDKAVAQSYERGLAAVYGVAYIRPEFFQECPRSRRALTSWRRIQIAGEGAPVTWEAVMAVQEVMRRGGDTEAADIAVISADCYLRKSDWSLLHPWDVVYT